MIRFVPPQLRYCRRSRLCYLRPEKLMLHVWLIPALMVAAAIVGAFYLLVKYKGGTGVRTEGRTVVDKPVEEENPPPS